jgi:twitching motility two-component system response regulator PilH
MNKMSRILVVEDSPTALYMVAELLAREGYDVIKATDGEEALRLAAQEQPQLILLDVILPKLNGYQVCRQIKAALETRHIPVVMITSKAKDKDRDWGIEQGADGYVVKPVDSSALREVIGQFVPSKG